MVAAYLGMVTRQRIFAMSKQLAISACISILAMAGLALAAPAVADHASAQAHLDAGATTITAAAPLFGN